MFVATCKGHLTKDPERKYDDKRKNEKGYEGFVVFSIGVNIAKDKSEFVSCIAHGKTANFVEKYFGKGDAIFVAGDITGVNLYKNKDKKVGRTIKMTINRCDFASSSTSADVEDDLEDVEIE